MKRPQFESLLHDAIEACLEFARTFLIDQLPNKVTCRVFPNQSYDGNSLRDDEYVFPEDSLAHYDDYLEMEIDEVVRFLWRDERIPEWVDVSVVATTETATVIQLLCCGRFTSNEDYLYYTHANRGPFGVKGSALPSLDYDRDKDGKFPLFNPREIRTAHRTSPNHPD